MNKEKLLKKIVERADEINKEIKELEKNRPISLLDFKKALFTKHLSKEYKKNIAQKKEIEKKSFDFLKGVASRSREENQRIQKELKKEHEKIFERIQESKGLFLKDYKKKMLLSVKKQEQLIKAFSKTELKIKDLKTDLSSLNYAKKVIEEIKMDSSISSKLRVFKDGLKLDQILQKDKVRQR